MSKSIFKKTAAIVCSAATLVALSATAMLAGAQTTLTKDERASEIAANGPTMMADKVIAEPGEKVKYGMFIANNSGFSSCNGYFVYDKALAPYVYENAAAQEATPWTEAMGIDVEPEFVAGEADTPTSAKYGRNAALYVTPSVNGTVNRFAFGTIGTTVNSCPEGLMFYMYFKVPDDAKPGTEYPVELTIAKFLNNDGDATEFSSVNGWIRVAGGTTTETTTSSTTTETTTSETTTSETTTSETTTSETTTSETTTSETTTSETTTSETTTSETTTSETTTSETTTSETTTSETTTSETTTSETTTSETTTSETTTGDSTTGSTDSTTSSTTTTPAKGGNTPAGTQAPGAKTGDAGVGAAVAGLLLAAGAAVAVASKKKED